MLTHRNTHAHTHARVRAGIKGVWSLRRGLMDAHDSHLVLAFVGETRVLALNAEEELDEAELPGFQSDEQVREFHFETTSAVNPQPHFIIAGEELCWTAS